MRVLTPSGYQSPVSLANGAEVCAFDSESGAAIVNHVENIDVVDISAWRRWWQVEENVPSFDWIKVNGSFLLFREQSIWRNGTNVCHARDLVVGDEIYDDTDQPIAITSLETVTDETLVWYRFDIDGDHSYIVDGLTVHNASRFWVGGTGTWDSSTTTHWASSSGSTGGQSVPGSSDAVTLDGSSGGGTVTLNFGGTITIQQITMGAFTGTFDNSVNNNNMTLTGSNGFSATGSGTRTIKLGSATYTLTAGNAAWNFQTTTNLTFDGASANVVFSGATGTCSISPGNGLSQGNFSFGASSGSGRYSITQSATFASIALTAPATFVFPFVNTVTVTVAFNWIGTASSPIYLLSSNLGSTATIAAAAGSQLQWCGIRDLTFTGSPTTTNCLDLGNNSPSITPPSGGAAAVASPGLHPIEQGIAA